MWLAFLLNGDDNWVIAAVVGLGFGVYSFFRGFKLLRNKRIVENTPTSKCRSVAMGLAEVAGRAVGQRTVPSLIGKIPSFSTHVKIERYVQRRKNSKWEDVHEEQDGIPFQVEDETGRVKVDPAGAELDVPPDIEYSTNGGLGALLGITLSRMNEAKVNSADVPSRFYAFCNSRGVGTQGEMRFTERNLSPGDDCYVLGTAGEIPGVADEFERVVIKKGKHHPWFFIAEASEKQVLSRLGTHTWLHIFGGAALTLACLAALLLRFGLW